MTTRRIVLGSAGGLISLLMLEQKSSGGVRQVFTQDLPNLALKSWAVTAVEVSYGPGESTHAHRHPGITIGYVVEGEIESKVGDEPATTYTAGEMFLETPGQLHSVSRNASNSRAAKLLAILLAPKGKPLTTPER